MDQGVPSMDQGVPSDARGAGFSREELDAAEPERHPSPRRRWLVGMGIGVVGGAWAGLLTVLSPVVLLCLPFAFTAAGAGALVGAGLVWTIPALVSWRDITASGDPLTILAWGSGVVVLLAGLLGTAVIVLRGRARPG
jgi:hypothetical protein